jgi:hypothetical protein
MWAMMPDLLVAIVIFSLFLLLAVAAPIWGYDSRDGIDSNEYARRAPWLYDRRSVDSATTLVGSGTTGTGQQAGALLHARHRAAPAAMLGACITGAESAY